jgi:hypothetical protein
MAAYQTTCSYCCLRFEARRRDHRFCSKSCSAQSSQRDARARRLAETKSLLQEQSAAVIARSAALAAGNDEAARAADRALSAIGERAEALFTLKPRTRTRARVAA